MLYRLKMFKNFFQRKFPLENENFSLQIDFFKQLLTTPINFSLQPSHPKRTIQIKLSRYNLLCTKRLVFKRATAGGGRPPLTIYNNWKKYLDFWKKCPDYVLPWVNFSIQNVVLRVSMKKTPKFYPMGSFFLLFLTKCLSKCPNSMKPPLPWKYSGCAPGFPFWY